MNQAPLPLHQQHKGKALKFKRDLLPGMWISAPLPKPPRRAATSQAESRLESKLGAKVILQLRVSPIQANNPHRHMSLPPPTASPIGQPFIAPQRDIRLQGIRNAYTFTPGKPVLDSFNLSIPVNTSMGIKAPKDADKSAVMDILLDLLAPQADTLSVNDEPITTCNLPAWQTAIGHLPQNIYIADASVAAKIAIDMQAMERAARAAQIHDFVVNELPLGYDTLVSDRGTRFSSGQRQCIGIARALYRDPPVLFFDEATSALDGVTEDALNEAIRGLSGDKTIVVIAHKEASLRGCARTIRITAQL